MNMKASDVLNQAILVNLFLRSAADSGSLDGIQLNNLLATENAHYL